MTKAEALAEIERLRTALALEEADRGVSQTDMGVAGRVAITRLRDTDYPELAAAVERLPVIYRQAGAAAAFAYARGHLRSLVDALILASPRTGDLVQAQHRVHAFLSPGEAELMFRSDTVGDLARLEFIEVVERYCYSLSIRAAFAHGSETPAGIMAPAYQRAGEE